MDNILIYDMPTHYSSVLIISLHCYRFGLIILTKTKEVVAVNVFLTSVTVVRNHFAEGSEIQIYGFVRQSH